MPDDADKTVLDAVFDSIDIHANAPRQFNFKQAQQLLPLVRKITAQAEQELQPIQKRIHNMVPADPRLPDLLQAYRQIVSRWQGKMRRLGISAQGLWQLGFDNGEGWWSWQHPERSLRYQQDYQQSFAERRLIQRKNLAPLARRNRQHHRP